MPFDLNGADESAETKYDPAVPRTDKQLARFLVIWHDRDRYRMELLSTRSQAIAVASMHKGLYVSVTVRLHGTPDRWTVTDVRLRGEPHPEYGSRP